MSDRLLKESDVLRIAFQLPLVVNSAFADAVKALPSADRPLGKWIVRFPYEDTGKTRTCSNCGITQTVNVYDGVVRFKFCPYCGAMMKGEDDEVLRQL